MLFQCRSQNVPLTIAHHLPNIQHGADSAVGRICLLQCLSPPSYSMSQRYDFFSMNCASIEKNILPKAIFLWTRRRITISKSSSSARPPPTCGRIGVMVFFLIVGQNNKTVGLHTTTLAASNNDLRHTPTVVAGLCPPYQLQGNIMINAEFGRALRPTHTLNVFCPSWLHAANCWRRTEAGLVAVIKQCPDLFYPPTNDLRQERKALPRM